MEKYKLPLWVPLVVLYAIGVAGFWAPSYIPAIAALAKNGINDQWLGFAGAVLGAAATLLTGVIALFAAYKTLIPMRRQLDQLIKQNDHNLYDRLLLRASRVNEEENLVRKVVDDCSGFDRLLKAAMQGQRFAIQLQPLISAAEKLRETVRELGVKKGDVWGDVATQRVRNSLVDMAVGCGSTATSIAESLRGQPRLAFITQKHKVTSWGRLHRETAILADRLFGLLLIEAEKIGQEIAATEKRLFGDGVLERD